MLGAAFRVECLATCLQLLCGWSVTRACCLQAKYLQEKIKSQRIWLPGRARARGRRRRGSALIGGEAPWLAGCDPEAGVYKRCSDCFTVSADEHLPPLPASPNKIQFQLSFPLCACVCVCAALTLCLSLSKLLQINHLPLK